MAAMMASLKPPPPPAGLPAGSLPEEELSHVAMAELCAAYAAVGEDGGGEPSGMVPPMWRAANDNAVASMKSLHYYRKCAVDGFDAANRHDATMPSHVASTNGHLEVGLLCDLGKNMENCVWRARRARASGSHKTQTGKKARGRCDGAGERPLRARPRGTERPGDDGGRDRERPGEGAARRGEASNPWTGGVKEAGQDG